MSWTRSFSRAPESVGDARRFVTKSLGRVPADVREAIELMVSELATNCLRHTQMGFDLSVSQRDGRVRVEVTDRSVGKPTMRSPGPLDPTGRGLQIVNMLAEAWGVEHAAVSGKTVWFTIAVAG